MLAQDLGDYLTSQSGGTLTQGTNLFLGARPPTPDACLTVYETGGLPPVHAFNPAAGQAKVEMARVQVVARAAGEDYEAARLLAHRAFVLLDGLPSRSINGVAYKWGAAIQSPFLMGRDEQSRLLVACNFDIVKELSTTS